MEFLEDLKQQIAEGVNQVIERLKAEINIEELKLRSRNLIDAAEKEAKVILYNASEQGKKLINEAKEYASQIKFNANLKAQEHLKETQKACESLMEEVKHIANDTRVEVEATLFHKVSDENFPKEVRAKYGKLAGFLATHLYKKIKARLT